MKYIIRKFCKTWIVLFAALIALIFYNEIYSFGNHDWSKLKCNRADGEGCTRILLVADPQLIGLRYEVLHFLTPISIWDSDVYLAKTYSQVLDHAKPNVVIFLGDLLDEGSRATEPDFKYYMKRFFSIFNLDFNNPSKSDNMNYIFLPGDNDIGGEGLDRLTNSNIYRFERTFLQPGTVDFANMTFYKVNRLTQSIPYVPGGRDFYKAGDVRVALSHKPLMFMPSLFVDKVLKNIQPQLIFTAHEHKSMIIEMDMVVQKDRRITPVNDKKIHEFALGVSDVYEINVPTCSYRMGTSRVGYGFALIENGELRYTVLWSPPRFKQLLHYLILGIFCLLVSLCRLSRCCRCRQNQGYTAIDNNNKPIV